VKMHSARRERSNLVYKIIDGIPRTSKWQKAVLTALHQTY
jgi:hypothetical protein